MPDTDNETFKNHTDPLTLKFKGRELTVTPNDVKYYLYYYHFIKHNDNNNPAEMGPMEFGVVRNNIYKALHPEHFRFAETLRSGRTR